MRTTSQTVLDGVVAGTLAAASMTIFRMLLHRAGWLDRMVPQVVEEWVRGRTRVRPPFGAAGHRALDQLLHLSYGAGWGALWGLASRRSRRRAAALGFGALQWAVGSMILFPGLGIGRPAWRSRARENAMNLGAHLLYAGVTAFLAEELGRQGAHRPGRRGAGRGRDVG